MPSIALQISPEAKNAYFSQYIQVAEAELEKVFGHIEYQRVNIGPFDYLIIDNCNIQPEKLLRLSFVQGLYDYNNGRFKPIELKPDFLLHEDFVFGSKYKGKTNEHLTQMLINVGMSSIDAHQDQNIKLLDPMCGRGTSLLWAMRYKLQAKGIEQDSKAIGDVKRNIKKWCKIHKQKHKLEEGTITGLSNKTKSAFIDFSVDTQNLRLAIGDATQADEIYKKDKFDLIVSDLPYGVGHLTTDNTRNPLGVLEKCAPAWNNCLKKTGAIVLAFNSNNPKRNKLVTAFESNGFMAEDFSANHRMSESIVRDILIFKKKN